MVQDEPLQGRQPGQDAKAKGPALQEAVHKWKRKGGRTPMGSG